MLIKPLQLGGREFATNLIQGPLAGVTCAPFRRLTWIYGKPAFSYTEMISCHTLLHKPTQTQTRYLTKAADEGPVCFQLAANEHNLLAEATKRVTQLGADLIDLNCGCPVKKIRRKGAGSSLLTSPNKLYHLIKAMKQNTHLPVSIKIRVEGAGIDRFHTDVVKAIEDAGADFLVVHGRHWTEHYDVPCNYEHIKFFVDELNIPVIGNGDVACLDSLKKMFATGCAGVMIGRAGVGQPWLIQQLTAQMSEQQFTLPSPRKVADLFLQHVQDLIELLGSEKFAMFQARSLAKYYARGRSWQKDFRDTVNNCDNFDNLVIICQQFFPA